LTGVWFKSFEGNLGRDGRELEADATLMRTVAGAAGTYDLTFYAKREVGFSSSAMFVRLSTDVGDTEMFDLLSLLVPTEGSWNQYGIFDFIASAGTTVLTVEAVMDGGFLSRVNPQSFMVDDFDLRSGTPSVPEPGTLLLTGIGAFWLLKRRRPA
jgi:hypothetical protein